MARKAKHTESIVAGAATSVSRLTVAVQRSLSIHMKLGNYVHTLNSLQRRSRHHGATLYEPGETKI
jgi:hypothetical protein